MCLDMRYTWHRSNMLTVLSYEHTHLSEACRDSPKTQDTSSFCRAQNLGSPPQGQTRIHPENCRGSPRTEPPQPWGRGQRSHGNHRRQPNIVSQRMPQCPWPSASGMKTGPQLGAAASSGERQCSPPSMYTHTAKLIREGKKHKIKINK